MGSNEKKNSSRRNRAVKTSTPTLFSGPISSRLDGKSKRCAIHCTIGIGFVQLKDVKTGKLGVDYFSSREAVSY